MWPFKTKSARKTGMSMLSVLRQQQSSITPHSCSKCGKTFMLSSRMIDLITLDTSGYLIDVGGYCNYCQKYVCQKHCKLLSKEHIFNKYRLLFDSETIKSMETNQIANMTYVLACDTCEMPLVSKP
jgi:hypothetical protein